MLELYGVVAGEPVSYNRSSDSPILKLNRNSQQQQPAMLPPQQANHQTHNLQYIQVNHQRNQVHRVPPPPPKRALEVDPAER